MELGNYLRVRGEYVPLGHMEVTHMELPPRARRILHPIKALARTSGTTSACAENTGIAFCVSIVAWNYLRVRGEYPK